MIERRFRHTRTQRAATICRICTSGNTLNSRARASPPRLIQRLTQRRIDRREAPPPPSCRKGTASGPARAGPAPRRTPRRTPRLGRRTRPQRPPRPRRPRATFPSTAWPAAASPERTQAETRLPRRDQPPACRDGRRRRKRLRPRWRDTCDGRRRARANERSRGAEAPPTGKVL
jgi:hypothetical protein